MPKVRDTLPAERVRCPECGARPFVRCTSDSGISRKPHGKRVARFNGLNPCPQRGSFQRPKDGSGIQYDEEELEALAPLKR